MTDNATVDADYQPIEVRRQLCEVHLWCGSYRIYDTTTASRQWHKEPRHNTAAHFSGMALYLGLHGEWFAHYYHQWDRYNSIVPLTRHKAIGLTLKHEPKLVLPLFGPLPEAGERIRPRRKKP